MKCTHSRTLCTGGSVQRYPLLSLLCSWLTCLPFIHVAVVAIIGMGNQLILRAQINWDENNYHTHTGMHAVVTLPWCLPACKFKQNYINYHQQCKLLRVEGTLTSETVLSVDHIAKNYALTVYAHSLLNAASVKVEHATIPIPSSCSFTEYLAQPNKYLLLACVL